MSSETLQVQIQKLCDELLVDAKGRYVPARLQTALALLESVRENASLQLDDHRASAGSSGLRSHETFGNKAHERLGLLPLNKNHGRRSSHLQEWGQRLLDTLKEAGLMGTSDPTQGKVLDEAQEAIGTILKRIAEQDPIRVHSRGRSSEFVIGDILEQAADKGRIGDCAQYLVGAKLLLRFPDLEAQLPVMGANKGDRKSFSDEAPRKADFELNDSAIEVAAGLPDAKHIEQVVSILDDTETEVWLLTRHRHVSLWTQWVEESAGQDRRRVIVNSIEAFVGQNLTELGTFSNAGKSDQLRTLLEIYNTRWIAAIGTPGIAIELLS